MEEKKILMTEEDAQILVDFTGKITPETVIDLYGRGASMRTITATLQALINLRSALITALQE